MVTGQRRTKEEMEIYHAEQAQMTEFEREMNSKLEVYRGEGGKPFNPFKMAGVADITWDWFKQLPDPKRALKAYLIANMFNEFSRIYDDKYVADYANAKYEEVPAKLRPGYETPFHVVDFNVLKGGFLGTRNWKVAQRILDIIEDKTDEAHTILGGAVSPAVYLGKLFENDYYYHTNHPDKHTKPPFFNEMVNCNAIKYYNQSYTNQRYSIAQNQGRVTTSFQGSLAIQHMEEMYYALDNDINVFADHTQFSTLDPASIKYTKFTKDVLEKAKDMLTPEEMVTLHSFLDEQFNIILGTNLSALTSSDAFAYAMVYAKGNPTIDPEDILQKYINDLTPDPETFGYIKDVHGGTVSYRAVDSTRVYHKDDFWESLVKTFKYHTSRWSSRDSRNYARLVKEYFGVHTSWTDLTAILTKLGNLVPVNALGVLDRTAIKRAYTID